MNDTRTKKRWTNAEREQIRLLFEQGKTDKQIAEQLHRTPLAVMLQRIAIGLKRPDAIDMTLTRGHQWKEWEDEFIMNFWREKSDKWMANKLGVTFQTYKKHRQKLGFIKKWTSQKGRRNGWTFTQEQYLLENYGKITVEEISKHLCKTPVSIWGKAHRLGLKAPHNYGRGGYPEQETYYTQQ